jgi:nucleoside phosphorylase
VLLITAAVRDELEPLLADADFTVLSDTVFRHVRKPVLVAAAGIGLVDFAAGLKDLFFRFGISRALLTGTCGVYPDAATRWPLNSLVSPARITLGDTAEALGSGYFPKSMACCCRRDGAWEEILPGVERRGHCLSLTAITSGDAAARRIGAFYQADFEQMEAFSFTRLCQQQKVPAAMLLTVANQVGSRGHRQWLENAAPGAVRCARVLKTLVEQLEEL